jgi:mRNA-degrading endonuclease toxin of MazEF toxin-antitoxin module
MQQGSIVIAMVADPSGANPKERPLVVVSPSAAIKTGEPIVAAAISTQFNEPVLATEVKLPFHPKGTARTGLTKPCVAKCDWLCTLQPEDIRAIRGYVSGETLKSILAIINAKPQ